MPTSDPDGAGARMLGVRQGAGRHGLGRLPDPVLPADQRVQGAHQEPDESVRGRLVRQLERHRREAQRRRRPDRSRVRPGGAARGRALRRHRPEEQPVRDRPASAVLRDGLRDGRRATARGTTTRRTSTTPACRRGSPSRTCPTSSTRPRAAARTRVNTGYYAGRLDGFTIVVGHEIEETVTDPGAEDVINGVNLGGWYDATGWENADKCAWVGYTFGVQPGSLNIPARCRTSRGTTGSSTRSRPCGRTTRRPAPAGAQAGRTTCPRRRSS